MIFDSNNITDVGSYSVTLKIALRYFPLAQPLTLTMPISIFALPNPAPHGMTVTAPSPLPWILLVLFTIAGIIGGFFVGWKLYAHRLVQTGGTPPSLCTNKVSTRNIVKVSAAGEESDLANVSQRVKLKEDSEDPDHNLLPDRKPKIRSDRWTQLRPDASGKPLEVRMFDERYESQEMKEMPKAGDMTMMKRSADPI